MVKKKWEMKGSQKQQAAKVSKTLAEVGKEYAKGANQKSLMKQAKVGLDMSKVPTLKSVSGKGIGGMSVRKKGWKKPGKRGIMGL